MNENLIIILLTLGSIKNIEFTLPCPNFNFIDTQYMNMFPSQTDQIDTGTYP